MENQPTPKPGRRWLKWTRRVVLAALVPIILGTGKAFWVRAAADRELRSFLADLDTHDPGWRLEDIIHNAEPIPPAENSARVVAALQGQLPVNSPAGISSSPNPSRPMFPLEDRIGILPPNVLLAEALTRELRTELGRVAPVLVEARRLAHMPRGRHTVAWSPDFIGTLLKGQLAARELNRLLCLNAILRAQEGSTADALQDCQAAINAGRSIDPAEPMTLITFLIRSRCIRQAGETLQRVLGQGQTTEKALRSLQHLLEDEDQQPLLAQAARGERAAGNMLFSNMESGKVPLLNDNRHLEARLAFWLSGEAFLKRNHVSYLRCMTEFVEAARLPEARQEEAFARLNAQLQQLQEGDLQQLPFTGVILPAVMKTGDSARKDRAALRCAIAGLAVERYRLRHGHWPASLATLVQDGLLPTLPLDPYGGEPLRFRRLDDGVRVYSAGPEHVNDSAAYERWRPAILGPDLGFQLWDVNQRRQPSES